MNLATRGNDEFPRIIVPEAGNRELVDWATQNKNRIRSYLNRFGAIVFRGFDIDNSSEFEKFASAATTDQWVDYREASTPRSHVRGNIYTSTEYPKTERIFFHNENSHTTSWPLYLFFYCEKPSENGGETTISDCRKIYNDIPKKVRINFEKKGILYVRNFGYNLGIPWQKGFPVTSKREMDEYCVRNSITPVWKEDDKLRIIYKRWASLSHPVTNEKIWFNHGTFFNPHTLEPKTKELLIEYIGEDHIPYNTFYGDGSAIEAEIIELLIELYRKHSVNVEYKERDILMIDNMLVAHGREPYTGERSVNVAMTNNISYTQFDQAFI